LSGKNEESSDYLDKDEQIVRERLMVSQESRALNLSMAKILACRGMDREAFEYLKSDTLRNLSGFEKRVFSAFIRHQKSLFFGDAKSKSG